VTTIRDATPAVARRLLDLHVASIRAFGPDVYDDEQVAAWAERDGPEYPIDEAGQRVVVAERTPGGDRTTTGEPAGENELAGFSHLAVPESEVQAVYVHPEHARQGVGWTILDRLEALAREAGLDELELLASRNAVGFYERAGYESVERVVHETTGGVELGCIEMRRHL
jgi:putative acetyltransferase